MHGSSWKQSSALRPTPPPSPPWLNGCTFGPARSCLVLRGLGFRHPRTIWRPFRLLHAAYLFETAGLSVADVSYRLEYSSPQSFGRHLRAMLGLTALEFRRRFPFPVALSRFIELMVEPYVSIWQTFHPVAAGSWDGERPLYS
jgi:hypothetical protein